MRKKTPLVTGLIFGPTLWLLETKTAMFDFSQGSQKNQDGHPYLQQCLDRADVGLGRIDVQETMQAITEVVGAGCGSTRSTGSGCTGGGRAVDARLARKNSYSACGGRSRRTPAGRCCSSHVAIRCRSR